MRTIFLILCLMPLAAGGPLHAQPLASVATNYVLELDGTGGYVELPPNIFNDLEEATVEAWARWDIFSGESKRVFNYGDARHDMGIMNDDPSADGNSAPLSFVVCDGDHQAFNWLTVPGILRTRKWCHVAAVSGKGGMRLYLNGTLIGTNGY